MALYKFRIIIIIINGDTAYITQLKQQESKTCYYFCSTSP